MGGLRVVVVGGLWWFVGGERVAVSGNCGVVWLLEREGGGGLRNGRLLVVVGGLAVMREGNHG